MLPEDLLGRDRSPSGPVCGGPISAMVRVCSDGPVCSGPISAVFRVCGRGAFGEIALPRKRLGEVGFLPPGGRPKTSWVGTDLRAVRVCSGPISAAVHVCGRGAFGEIALPRKRLGEVEFVAGIRNAAR